MTMHINIYDERYSDSCLDFFQSGETAEEILSRICTYPGLRWERISQSREIYRLSFNEIWVGTVTPVVESSLVRIHNSIRDYVDQFPEYK